MLSTMRATILYAMILVSGGMLFYTYPTWKMFLLLVSLAFIFQTAMMMRSTLIEIAGGFPGISGRGTCVLTLKRAHQLVISPLPPDIDVLWDGNVRTSPAGHYKVRLVRSGTTWYAQRTPDGVTFVSTRTPLNYSATEWTTWFTIEVLTRTTMPPLTFDPDAPQQQGQPRPVYVPTREAVKAKAPALVVMRTSTKAGAHAGRIPKRNPQKSGSRENPKKSNKSR